MEKTVGNCLIEGADLVGFVDEFQEKLVIPEGIEVIAEGALQKYYGLVAVEFPSTLRRIDERAFYSCSNLRKVCLPASVEQIKCAPFLGAFGECKQLLEADFSATSISVLGTALFCDCRRLQTVRLPQTLIKIDYDTFRGCTALSSVVLNEGLKILETDFSDNKHLEILNIPDSVIHIEDLSAQNHIKTVIISPKQLERFDVYLPGNCKVLLRN